MFGIEISIVDIEGAVSDFMAIPAVVPLVAATLAMPLILLVVGALRSVLGSR